MRTCSVACCPARISSTPLASTSGALPSYHPLVITPRLFLFRSPFFRRIALGARALFCQPAGLRARPSVHAAQGRGRVKGRKRLWRSSDLARSRTPALESRRLLGAISVGDIRWARGTPRRAMRLVLRPKACGDPLPQRTPGGGPVPTRSPGEGVDGMATSFFSPCISPLPALCSDTVCKTTGCNSCGGAGRLSRATTCVAVKQIKLMTARL
jgi:hypothetical protein